MAGTGVNHFRPRLPDDRASAKTLLERARAIDPESAEANMVLSLINHHVAILGFASDPAPAMEAAYALGRRAVQLDDRNEYAHWAEFRDRLHLAGFPGGREI